MTPFFQSWQDFFHMGGYGFFVWLAYGIAFVAMVAFIITTLIQKKRLLKNIHYDVQREQRIKNMTTGNK